MTAPADSTHEEHASKLHAALSQLEALLHLAADPAVLALLPPKYQGYVQAAAAVDTAIHAATP